MLSAHMDEVGLMVRHITPEGFLTIQTLGGWLDQALINQRWIVMTRNGPIPGLTGIKTVHVMQPDARTQVFKKESMFIDVGAADKDDAEQRLGIRPGDPIAPDSRFQEMAGGELYVGKAWDDRAGVAGLVEVARALRVSDAPLAATVYLVATVQEEVGLRGAHTSSFHVMPDIGINLESGVAGDYPGITKDEAQEELGKGPTVFLHDSSMLPNLRLPRFLRGHRRRTGNPSPVQRLERLRRGRRGDAESGLRRPLNQHRRAHPLPPQPQRHHPPRRFRQRRPPRHRGRPTHHP